MMTSSLQAEGGPPLLYDHQLCVDEETQILFVFGGRTILPEKESHRPQTTASSTISGNSGSARSLDVAFSAAVQKSFPFWTFFFLFW